MRRIAPALMLLVGLACLTPALAQDCVLRDFRVVRACAGDVADLCAGVPVGDGRIKACLKENMSKLSAGCVAPLLTAMAAARETP